MARSSTRQDLFLSIGGTADPLKDAAKAGRTALLELGNAANDVQEEVSKALQQMGANAPSAAKQIEQSYNKTFAAIRRNAQAALSAPSSSAALQIIDVAAAEQAAAAAETEAAALRQVATAATNVAQRAGEAGAALRVLAVAAETNAQLAEQEAAALRTQANLLADVRTELGAMGVAQGKATTASAQQRQGVLILGEQVRQFGTEISTGISPVQAFSQQLGQGAFALTLFDGKLGKVGEFLGGPWGIATTVAVTVLTPFVAKLLEGGDALAKETEKLKENADKAAIADQAKKAFLDTEAGAIDDVRKLTDEIEKQNDALKTNAERMNIRAKNRLEFLQNDRADVQQQLDQARKDAAGQQIVAGGAAGQAVASSAAAAQKVNDLEARLKNIDNWIAKANADRAATDADLADESARRAADPIAQIKRTYEGPDGLIEQAKKRAVAEGAVTAELTRQLTVLRTKEKAEIEAAQKAAAAARNSNNNDQGRVATVAQATAIIESIGGRVTSGLRSHADQERIYADKLAGRHAGPVAKPGTSDHERGQAIDVAFGPGISPATIRAAFAKQGVQIHQLLTETAQGVYHVGFNAKGPSDEQVARQQQAEQDKRTRDAQAYSDLLNRAQQDHLDLARQQVSDIAEGADLDAKSVELERQRLDAQAQAGVALRRWTQAQANAVITLNQQNADLKTSAIRQHEATQLLDQQLATDRDRIEASNTILQLQSDLATTNTARKQIALRLLANDEQEQRDRATKLLGSDDINDQLRGDAMMRDVDAQHPYRVAQINRQFAGPLDRYRDQLQQNVGDWNTALEGVKTDGLQGIEDGFVGIISGTETVSQAFKQMADEIIADLARIAIEKLILSVVGLKDGGEVLHLAGGGPVFGPGGPREDRVPAMLSAGEYVINAAAYARHPQLIEAINTGQLPGFADGGLVAPGRIYMRALPSAASIAPRDVSGTPITFDLRGAVMTEDLLRQMNAISARNSQVAILGGSRLAQSEIADQQHQAIP